MKIFSSPIKVTQKFGVDPKYYGQFGLVGHEGLDVIPTSSDYSVYSFPYKGIVVRDIDMAEKGGNYGNHCTIWYPDIKEAWMYCHLATNVVYEGLELPPASYLGQMGATGNTNGAHLHLNRFQVDTMGRRLNKDNGYLGGIDPLPFLQSEPTLTPTQPEFNDQTKISAKLLGWEEDLEVQAIRGKLGDLKKLKDIEKQRDRLAAELSISVNANIQKDETINDLIVKLQEALKTAEAPLATHSTENLLREILGRWFGR